MAKFGNPETQVAFSVFENKGVFALLLGSGLSRAAEIPTGWEITTDLVRRVAQAEGVEDQADWAQWYRDKYGKEPDYSELLGELASTPAERRSILHSYIEPNEEDREEGRKLPTAGHKAIAQLVRDGFIRVIVTTNFDRLMENALREVGVEPTVVGSVDALKGAEPLAHTACYILKLHGDYKDERILNTAEELHGYPAEYDALLDRILDEYGLIVCGWSGEWDNALRASILRAPNRRYPMFWASRGELRGRGKELCDHRKGIQVAIADADKFFSGLVEQVRTLAESQRQNPAEVALLISRAKRYLAKSEYRIQLSDLIDSEVQKIIDRLNEADMPPNGRFTKESFTKIINLYESAAEGLIKVSGLIGVWGDAYSLRLVSDAIRNLWVALQTPKGGNTLYLGLSGYVSVIVCQATMLGLVKASRWKEFRELLHTEVPGARGTEEVIHSTIVPTQWPCEEKQLWNLLFDGQEYHTPLANRLHQYFAVEGKDFLGMTANFNTLHLTGELLVGIASIDGHSLKELEEKLGEDAGWEKASFRAPVWGRIGWDHWATQAIFERLQGGAFPKALATAGFGGGSEDVVKATIPHMQRCIGKLHWH